MKKPNKYQELFHALAAVVGAGEFAKLMTAQSCERRIVQDLLLPSPVRQPPLDITPAAYLNPEYQMVDFDYRDEDFAEFQQWADWSGDSLNAWRLVHGDTGRGKTRMMVELVQKLRKDGNQSGKDNAWFAGFVNIKAFLDHDEADEFLAEFGSPLFIVVDYAERNEAVVTRLLKLSRVRAQSMQKLVTRIVLLSRKRSELWTQLFEQDAELAQLDSNALADVPLPPIPAEQNVDDLFDTAYRCFCTRLKKEPEVLDPDLSSLLQEGQGADIGLVHMAALVAALAPDEMRVGKNYRPTEEKVLEFLLARERRHWVKTAEARGFSAGLGHIDVLRDAATLITFMAQEASIESAEHARNILRKSTLLEGCSEPELQLVTNLFRDLYPGDGHVNGVTPDLLGAYLVSKELA